MAKLYDIKLTSANAPDALFTVYYNSVNSATIASLVSNNNSATNLTRAQLITGTGVRVAVPNNATSVLVYSSGCNTTVSAPVVDTTAPTPPTSLTASNVAQTTMTLSWGPGSDAYGVTNYLVYRNGTLIATIGNVLTYNVTGLTVSTSYTFTVYARDAAGNVSVASNSLVQATAGVPRNLSFDPTQLTFNNDGTPSSQEHYNIVSTAGQGWYSVKTGDAQVFSLNVESGTSSTTVFVACFGQGQGATCYVNYYWTSNNEFIGTLTLTKLAFGEAAF